jgi:hypothetical protein
VSEGPRNSANAEAPVGGREWTIREGFRAVVTLVG